VRYLLVLPLAILLVGFHVVNPQIGAIAVLLALLLSGVLWRLIRIVTGSVLVFLSFL
jgi:hypothetical protein